MGENKTSTLAILHAYKQKIWNKLFGVIHLRPVGKVRGNVLISYLTEAFTLAPWEDFSTYHTSYWECHEMARQFLERGYAVDIINSQNKTFVPKKRYDFFIDISSNLERLSLLLPNNCKKILHVVICHWIINNRAEYQKIERIWKVKGIIIKPRRILEPTLHIEHADLATVLGNAFTQGTFAYANKPLYQLPISATSLLEFPERNYSEARNNFLWIGGSGAALKGLDIALEAFAKMPDKKLYICGTVHSELDFQKAYWKELYETSNISYVGRVDVSSDEFKELVKTCAYVVYPSSSEGQSGAIIQAMHGGLIPLISYETGIDVFDFGKILENNSVETLCREVETFSTLPEVQIEQMSKKTWEYVRAHHTREAFSRSYEKFLTEILKI